MSHDERSGNFIKENWGKFLVSGCCIVFSLLLNDYRDLRRSVSILETGARIFAETYFTKDEGARIEKRIAKNEEEIRHFPEEIPPTWFRNEVLELGRKQELDRNKLFELEKKLAVLSETCKK